MAPPYIRLIGPNLPSELLNDGDAWHVGLNRALRSDPTCVIITTATGNWPNRRQANPRRGGPLFRIILAFILFEEDYNSCQFLMAGLKRAQEVYSFKRPPYHYLLAVRLVLRVSANLDIGRFIYPTLRIG